MFRWVARQYAKRIVNINVNICIAAIAAVVLTAGVLSLSRLFGVDETKKTLVQTITLVSDWFFDLVVAVGLHWLANHWPKRWKRSRHLIDKADSVIDAAPPPGLSIIKDAAAGALLPHLKHEDAASPGGKPGTISGPRKEISFVRDATTIQLQRLCLSPLFYVIAMGLQNLMLHRGFAIELSMAVPFLLAIAITRIIHTYWMLKTDPLVLEEWEQSRKRRQSEHVVPPTGPAPTPKPAEVDPMPGEGRRPA